MAKRLTLVCLFICFLASCASDSVSDRRVGQQIVCHKGKKTLAVSNAASFAHLDHGDSVGPCPGDP